MNQTRDTEKKWERCNCRAPWRNSYSAARANQQLRADQFHAVVTRDIDWRSIQGCRFKTSWCSKSSRSLTIILLERFKTTQNKRPLDKKKTVVGKRDNFESLDPFRSVRDNKNGARTERFAFNKRRHSRSYFWLLKTKIWCKLDYIFRKWSPLPRDKTYCVHTFILRGETKSTSTYRVNEKCMRGSSCRNICSLMLQASVGQLKLITL